MTPQWRLIKADATSLPLEDQSVDLVVGSPPYCDARTYGIGAQRDAREWVDWMLLVTAEALRVSRGAVVWIVGGITRDRTYWPAVEGLAWRSGSAPTSRPRSASSDPGNSPGQTTPPADTRRSGRRAER